MKTSEYLLATLKESPADAELASHKLMLRAGMIRKLTSGIYSWLPLGLRVLRKVETIIREEMNRIGALEIFMPAVQPAELWHETGRWEQYGDNLLKIYDRHKREFCFGPTHEEVVTDIVRREIKSYKQLPLSLYQIQTKFRDETRPRFGVMRAREFMMKDAYSFHTDETSLKKTYEDMYQAYWQIFTRLGLKFRAVEADTGEIGGSASHEFQVIADSGEDEIIYCENSNYAANVEFATALPPIKTAGVTQKPIELVNTPSLKTIEEVTQFINVSAKNTIKTLIVHGKNDSLVALVLRGDHELNVHKAEKLSLVKAPLTFATDAEILQTVGCHFGSIGPVNLNIPVIVDPEAANLVNFVCGANQDDHHYTNANWGRDANLSEIAAIRKIVAGDESPDGCGKLSSARGIEVGHVFQLGTKYSAAMNATVLDEHGKKITIIMGCYGIGVSRVVAAAIEQNHDERGIIWQNAMAPFKFAIIPIAMQKSASVKQAADKLYQELSALNYEVLFDDRSESPGVKFADMDLIGIPHQLILSEKKLASGVIEYKNRQTQQSEDIKIEHLMDFLKMINV